MMDELAADDARDDNDIFNEIADSWISGSVSDSFSGVDSPGVGDLQMAHELGKRLGRKVAPPKNYIR